MVPRDGQTWFFKLVGPEDRVGSEVGRFRELVESIQFPTEDGPPTWRLPRGWHQAVAQGMRYATISIDSPDTPLELTVTPLKPTAGDFNDYVLANVDRWRQQVGLDPTSKEKLFGQNGATGELERVKLRGGGEALIADLAGDPDASPASALAGSPAHPPMTSRSLGSEAHASNSRAPLAYKVPPGWTQGKRDGMRLAAFEVSDGAKRAEITVIALPASSGDLLANVNRWREQVKLAPIGADELKQQVNSIAIQGEPAQSVEMIGQADSTPREGILGVVCVHGDKAWFFKMKGDAALVDREKAHFHEFVLSVKFDGAARANDGQ